MKRYIWGLFLLLATASCSGQDKGGILSADSFQYAINSQSVQLLDVRTSSEYQGGHIAHSLQANWKDGEEFRYRVQSLDKTRPLYVYCASGGRSAAAAKWLKNNGFTAVYNLQGGMIAWKAAGKPVESMASIPVMSSAEYKSLVSSGTVLVDFGADWCPPCKKMEPSINRLQKELAGQFIFRKIDAGAQTELMKQMGIDKLPTFIIYKNGKEVSRHEGITKIAVLKKDLR